MLRSQSGTKIKEKNPGVELKMTLVWTAFLGEGWGRSLWCGGQRRESEVAEWRRETRLKWQQIL